MNTHPQIAKRAYEIWESAGRPQGMEMQHWLQAEAELQPKGTAASGLQAPAATTAAAKPGKEPRAQAMLKAPKSRRSSIGA